MKSQENRLITIPISHYCEKARWALEWSKIPYLEEQHLQGFHYIYTRKAAKSFTVPVLITPKKILSDSSDIINWCNSKASSKRKLLPTNVKQRKEAAQLEDYFDEELGIAGRLWIYAYLLHELPLILKYSKIHSVPAHEIKLMPMLFPLVKKRIEGVLGIGPTSREDSKAIIERAFDEVARRLKGKKFLVGNVFTAADLSFSALAASVLLPKNYGVKLPSLKELPPEMQKQIKRWRKHPAGKFALRIYKEYRTA